MKSLTNEVSRLLAVLGCCLLSCVVGLRRGGGLNGVLAELETLNVPELETLRGEDREGDFAFSRKKVTCLTIYVRDNAKLRGE